jgi:hypothetical protein
VEAEDRAARAVTNTHEQVTALLIAARNRTADITAVADQEATTQRAEAKAEVATACGEAERLLAPRCRPSGSRSTAAGRC